MTRVDEPILPQTPLGTFCELYLTAFPSSGGGVSRDNIKQLLVYTAATEVHVGSACSEIVEQNESQHRVNLSSGASNEGGCIKLRII